MLSEVESMGCGAAGPEDGDRLPLLLRLVLPQVASGSCQGGRPIYVRGRWSENLRGCSTGPQGLWQGTGAAYVVER